ncbi:MAG: hypothetical protein MHM6MM_005006 [Cercozoa sp. M6MM]
MSRTARTHSIGFFDTATLRGDYSGSGTPGAVASIKVEGLKNLFACDRSGTSDPFVTLAVCNTHSLQEASDMLRTPVKKKTLEVDCDLTVRIPLRSAAVCPSYCLRIQVYDKNTIGKNEKIGLVDVPISTESVTAPIEYALFLPPQTQIPRGVVTVSQTLEISEAEQQQQQQQQVAGTTQSDSLSVPDNVVHEEIELRFDESVVARAPVTKSAAPVLLVIDLHNAHLRMKMDPFVRVQLIDYSDRRPVMLTTHDTLQRARAAVVTEHSTTVHKKRKGRVHLSQRIVIPLPDDCYELNKSRSIRVSLMDFDKHTRNDELTNEVLRLTDTLSQLTANGAGRQMRSTGSGVLGPETYALHFTVRKVYNPDSLLGRARTSCLNKLNAVVAHVAAEMAKVPPTSSTTTPRAHVTVSVPRSEASACVDAGQLFAAGAPAIDCSFTLEALRGKENSTIAEFLWATDPNFAPVTFEGGPEDAMYVAFLNFVLKPLAKQVAFCLRDQRMREQAASELTSMVPGVTMRQTKEDVPPQLDGRIKELIYSAGPVRVSMRLEFGTPTGEYASVVQQRRKLLSAHASHFSPAPTA